MEKTMVENRLPMLNEVEGFNPVDYARVLQDESGARSLYLEVKDRILWFRLHRPDGKIVPEVLNVTENSALVRCRIYAHKADPEDQFIGQAYAQRFKSGDDKFGDRFVEIAETAATGRALATAGYGTQFCGSSDMLSGVISDAPIELPEEDAGDGAAVTSHAIHQLRQEPAPLVPPAIQQTPPQSNVAVPVEVPPQKPAQTGTLESMMASMTIEDAKNVVVDFGKYAGSTLGQIAMIRPLDLEWYVKHYTGKNTAIKAGASILLSAVQQRAS